MTKINPIHVFIACVAMALIGCGDEMSANGADQQAAAEHNTPSADPNAGSGGHSGAPFDDADRSAMAPSPQAGLAEGEAAEEPRSPDNDPQPEEAVQWIQLSTDDSTSMASAQIYKSSDFYGRGLKVHEFLNYYDPPNSLFANEDFARAKAINDQIRFGIKGDYQLNDNDPAIGEPETAEAEVPAGTSETPSFEEDTRDSDSEAPQVDEDDGVETERPPVAVGTFEVLFQMQADPIAKEDRRNWNLFLCVDVSGSMSGEKIAFTIDALTQIVPHLKSGDRLTLTTFNNEARNIFTHLEVSENEEQILRAFRSLNADGGTNMTAGLRQSYALAQEHYDANMLQRVILFGDGSANVGDTDIQTFTQLTRINGQEGIYLSGVGVGTGYDFERMDQLTDAGKGAHIFLPNQEEVDIIFGDYFSKLVEVSADAIAVEATLPSDIVLSGFSGEEVSFNPNQRLQNIVLAAGDDMTFTAKFDVLDEAALDEPLALKVTLRPLSSGETVIRKIEVDSIRELITEPGRLFERTRLIHRFGKYAANRAGDRQALLTDLGQYENPDWGIREIIQLLSTAR